MYVFRSLDDSKDVKYIRRILDDVQGEDVGKYRIKISYSRIRIRAFLINSTQRIIRGYSLEIRMLQFSWYEIRL